jgi:hypothetical protein
MRTGLLGRGTITDVWKTGMSVGAGWDAYDVCLLTVAVTLGRTPRYEAICLEAVSAKHLPAQLTGSTVAVRVDPDDHSLIRLDRWVAAA